MKNLFLTLALIVGPGLMLVVPTANAALPGTVVAWGYDGDGQTNVPTGLSGVTAIAAGYRDSAALKSDGTVVMWGGNDQHQTNVPAGLSNVTAIAAGGFHTVALKSNGTLVSWGGSGGNGVTNIPAGLTNVTAIAAGYDYDTVALKGDGTVVEWGDNSVGQTNVPTGLSGVTAIAAGYDYTVALKSDGTVVAWGYNATVPPGLTNVTAISAGYDHAAALLSNGTVVAWGDNTYGQASVPAGLPNVTTVAAGDWFTAALLNNGTVVEWGINNSGITNVPAGLINVTAIAAGGLHTLALVPTAPQLIIIRSTASVILTWPTNATGFTLQSTTNLVSPAVWTTVVPGPVAVNGNNTVTNPISGTQQFYRLSQSAIPSGMALIPAGAFTMGDTLDGEGDAIPISVTVSAFYMDTNLVSLSQWQGVYSYATSHGYGFDHAGAGKAANHPVQTVDWFDCVKWSNARSAQAGLTPVYYTDAGFTQVFTNGGQGTTVSQNLAANGYRLPTEAQWEKAARGGLSGQRFPWGNTISENQANYRSSSSYFYDLSNTGFNPTYATGGYPYTSPVGSFAPNGYGLYDMAGNVEEWCWDWYATPYGQPSNTNPTGPVGPLGFRVLRGGGWFNAAFASVARCAYRDYDGPTYAYGVYGFRCVRGL